VVTIALPPLAERREDIVPLFEHFLLDAAVRYQRPAPLLTESARMRLAQRDWPGNVRELRNAADRYVLGIPDDVAAIADGGAASSQALKDRVEQYERALIADALAQAGGAVAQAAEQLKMAKATLYEKIRRHGLVVRGEQEGRG
jgi:two-component system, NtrC family, C4-dicarboxylate transport response regulator DctD